MANKAGVIFLFALLAVTFGAIVHLHAVPVMALPTGDISSPDIDAVTGEAVFLVGRQFAGFGVPAVTCPALDFSHFYMGYM